MSGINTKLIYETGNGKIVALALGDLLNSNADLVCLSHFGNAGYKQSSVIGQLAQILHEKGVEINSLFTEDYIKKGFQLFDFSHYGLSFKVLIICLGDLLHQPGNLSPQDRALRIQNNVKKGLQNALSTIKSNNITTIDMAALGVQYGHLERSRSFDILLEWANEVLLKSLPTHTVRFVIHKDIDTFIDFYESMAKQKSLQFLERQQYINISTINYGDHNAQIQTALNNLHSDPRSVILICRNIIEVIAKKHSGVYNESLYNTISHLRNQVPPAIYSYLTTCRLLGNFANHDAHFTPTSRDAEAVLLLTIRIVEWYLAADQ
jgi:hypothetical protein